MNDSRQDKLKIYKKFLSFEGIDFSGKSTQIELLMTHLRSLGIQPTVVREPGGTAISEKIREILLSTIHEEMHHKTEILLYEAARAQLVHQRILPLLESGHYIIADRFYDSTTTYQGYGRGLDLEMVHRINQFATSGLRPYRTFYIDISPEVTRKRQAAIPRQQDRLEKSGTEFFSKIRQGFLALCQNEPERFVRIDGNRDRDEISSEIWQIIRKVWDLEK